MRQKKLLSKGISFFGWMVVGSTICLLSPPKTNHIEAARVTGSHIGTFEGSTTFTTTSRNGINPGLFIEVMDEEGNLTQYESEEGIITIPDTKEGAYVTQAKLFGETKYVDEDTGEIFNQFEEGRHLELASSEMPELIISNYQKVLGNQEIVNLYNSMGYVNVKAKLSDNGKFVLTNDGMWLFPTKVWKLEANTTYTAQVLGATLAQSNYINGLSDVVFEKFDDGFICTFTTDDTGEFGLLLRFDTNVEVDFSVFKGDFRSQAPITDVQTSVLTPAEDIVLSKINKKRDYLDLMKPDDNRTQTTDVVEYSQLTLDQHSKSIFNKVDGYTDFQLFTENSLDGDGGATIAIGGDIPWVGESEYDWTHFKNEIECLIVNNTGIKGRVKTERLSTNTINAVEEFLSSINPTIIYGVQKPKIQTINLTSTSRFKAIPLQNINVNGDIEPLLVSITVPTDSLSFTLDPNQEAGQQFIAPEFMLANETLAPLQIELKNFEQATNVLNDVLPDKYDTWEGLNQKESKDIALALVPTPSDGWLTLNEGPRYVVTTSNEFIGTVKGKSSVGFSFNALHGQSFSEVLTPQYRLAFVFGFSQ